MDWFKVLTVAGTAAGVAVVARDKKMRADIKTKWMAGIIATGGAVYGGRVIYNEIKRRKDLEQEFCGNLNISQVATEIYDALWNNDWFGVTEDEQAAIDAIKQVPKSCISSLAMVYNTMYGKNLREDFKFYLSNEQYDEVKHLFT